MERIAILGAEAKADPTSQAKNAPKGAVSTVSKSKESKKVPSSIEIVHNERVQKWIDYFYKRDSARFQRALNRGFFYQDIVERTLRESHLPPELFFLPLIESSYVYHAKSHASAVGIWQFMKGTGRQYGLRVNRYLDERKHVILSSQAAAKYLKDLYTAFGSWELAMAAYNCGEHRVLRAIMKGDTKDYWKLVEKKLLPKETRNYVPKFMAAVIVGQNPEKYGLKSSHRLNLDQYPQVKSVEVPSLVSLKEIAKVLGVSLPLLKKINPHLRSTHTPPRPRRYALWIPKKAGKGAATGYYAKLEKKRKKKHGRVIAGTKSSKRRRRYHVVRRGENLSKIARRYGKTVGQLKRYNGLASSRIIPRQRLSLTPSRKRGSKKMSYRVRRGDNLSRIAGRFGVSIAHIKRINDLDSSRIYIGQRLKI